MKEPEDSLLQGQKFAAWTYPELNPPIRPIRRDPTPPDPFQYCLPVFASAFLSGLLTKFICLSYELHIQATVWSKLNDTYYVIWCIEFMKFWITKSSPSSWISSFYFLRTLRRTLFANTPSPCLFLNVKDHVPHPYKVTCNFEAYCVRIRIRPMPSCTLVSRKLIILYITLGLLLLLLLLYSYMNESSWDIVNSVVILHYLIFLIMKQSKLLLIDKERTWKWTTSRTRGIPTKL